jgi:dephospho-CoA kinase
VLIGFSGLAGAGKTTAVDLLVKMGMGKRVYVGALITEEVTRRGMVRGPASENEVRKALRQEGGMDALARLAFPMIEDVLRNGCAALVDAIYCAEERSFFETALGDSLLCVAIETSVANRAERLSRRPSRPMTVADLENRDSYELDCLGLSQVMARSHRHVPNNDTLNDLELALHRLIEDCAL